ncbi:MAG TPA: hypothetical protein C5S37_00905 [Methanophagales archaeon]|nr:hypothetical protein [Methanophagales archaeon]
MRNEEGRIRKYKLLWKYPIDYRFLSVSISADGRYIAVGGDGNNAYLLKSEWDRGEFLRGYGTGGDAVHSVAITPDGDYIATGDTMAVYLLNKEGEVLWKYRTDRAGVVTLDPGVAITSDGSYIAALTGGDSVDYKLCLLSDGLLLWKYSFGRVLANSVSMTPDGKYIAVGGYSDGKVYLFRLLNEQEVIPAEREVAEKAKLEKKWPLLKLESPGICQRCHKLIEDPLYYFEPGTDVLMHTECAEEFFKEKSKKQLFPIKSD